MKKQSHLNLYALPSQVQEILQAVKAPPRLVAHLTLVHDVAVRITEKLRKLWPRLQYDQKAVLIGAATHDIGKVLHPKELVEAGGMHEKEGAALLQKYDFPEKYIHFTWTHAHWEEAHVELEDLLVAWADKIWKGKRESDLEEKLVNLLAGQLSEEQWSIFIKIDELAAEITVHAEERLTWQVLHPV